MANQYQMQISRMTVDKLGVKLYDRVYAVIAELISNSYDADATKVIIRAPMGQFLASKNEGVVTSKNVTIEVEDDGTGMDPKEMQDFYLMVGRERRTDPRRGNYGERSEVFKRAVMGRKGVGKLAPFGVCQIVEIISAGGKLIKDGKKQGYRQAHIILNKDDILDDTSSCYEPEIGQFDDQLSPKTFTKVILKNFYYRRINAIEELARQLAQRFGIQSKDWSIELIDTSKAPSSSEYSLYVGEFDVPVMDNTKIEFKGPSPTISITKKNEVSRYSVTTPGASTDQELTSGFWHDGRFYPVVGWVAYSKFPYKDELMAGVRIYCRGKFSAQTTVFNRKAGFTGEHSVRSYLVGELHADWLDEDEDLIQTDRRDILWSQELGEAFQDWGQKVVKCIGQISRDPLRKSTVQQFFEVGDVTNRINKEFPSDSQKSIRDTALEVARSLGKSLRGDELEDASTVEDVIQLSLLLAPIQNLDIKLRAASDISSTTVHIISELLKTARIAETSTFGHQVLKRLEIISRLKTLKDVKETPESELQDLIQSAPWLVNPQWVPIIANQSLNTLKKEIELHFERNTGQKINLTDFSNPKKRPDFVSFSQDGALQLVEIKKPIHKINNDEWERIQTYFDQLQLFFDDPKHKDIHRIANDFHITLVCDGDNLKGPHKKAFDSYLKDQKLTCIDWTTFLMRTTETHKEFLDEAERLKGVR